MLAVSVALLPLVLSGFWQDERIVARYTIVYTLVATATYLSFYIRRRLKIGIVFEGFDAYPRQPGEPDDYAAEYEPESTVTAIEVAIRQLGHELVRLDTPARSPTSRSSGWARGYP